MNAIILAAGLGSRFKDLTTHNHKAMFPVEGIPNLERTLSMLNEANISSVYVVTGHNAHVLRPAIEKFGATEIFNPEFKLKNNAYSFSLAAPFFEESWVIDADVVLFQNPFIQPRSRATSLLIKRKNNSPEWIPTLTSDSKIERIGISSAPKPSLLGVSFWPKTEAREVLKVLSSWKEEAYLDPSKYWSSIYKDLIETGAIHVYGEILPEGAADELDNVDDYQRVISETSPLS